MLDALVETTISRDVMLLRRIDKPALPRRLIGLGCRYPGQILSYTKMVGQLQDAGNTTTLAHHLDLLSAVGQCELFHWREGAREVDFVVRVGSPVTAIEVKSGRVPAGQPGLEAFTAAHRPSRGPDGGPRHSCRT